MIEYIDREYQDQCVDKIFAEWYRGVKSTMVEMATGTGKCLGKNTPVMMFDGTVKLVQDIRIGDVLMGPDSMSREVLSTVSGVDDLYKITPIKGDHYVVNGPHLLSIVLTNKRLDFPDNKIVHVEAQEFNSRSKTFRHRAKGYRVPIDWPSRIVCLDPYFLGLWLGDGTSRSVQITTADHEVGTWLKTFSDSHSLRLVKRTQPGNKSFVFSISGLKNHENHLLETLRFYRLIQNKHVPIDFKANSKLIRLQVLAGLIDSDGSLSSAGYDFISVNQRLAADTAFLARSVGLAAYVSECKKICANNGVAGTYWRVSISGNVSMIPVKIERKQASERRQNKDVLRTGISVEPFGSGEYFGFEITGDRRFLLGDFTVTHNTVVFSRVIKQCQPKRALVLAHRTELISQAKDKIEAITGLECEIEKADMYATTNWMTRSPVVVSSIQTQCSGPKDKRRYRRFSPNDFGVVIADECHHSTASSWRETIEWYQQNPDLKVLGVTATADRTDQEALGQLFETVAFKYGILDAIKDGYLVPITQQFVPVASLDYSSIKTTAGDLNEGDLARVMQQEKNIYGVCQPTIEAMFGLEPKTLHKVDPKDWRNFLGALGRKPRRTIIFTVSVEQAESYCNVFTRAMDGVEWVCGATSDQKRKDILDRFSRGTTSACVNCMVLTEGYDNPGVEMIVMARPTKSRSLYAQIIGRSTRTLPGIVDGIPTADERKAAIAASPKPFCIAEGTLVLTDFGEIPIEQITSDMKVWDGLDFVTHSGVIFRGEKQIIEYAGLKATPDHKVWTEKGWTAFGECAAKQIPIAVTGDGWKEIRQTDHYYRGDISSKRQGICFGGMRLWKSIREGLQQCGAWLGRLSQLWAAGSIPQMALYQVSGGETTLRQSKRTLLSSLWWPWNRISIFFRQRNGFVGETTPWAAQRKASRQDRQRWPLRAGEFEVSDHTAKLEQSARPATDGRASRLQNCPSQFQSIRRSSAKIVSSWVDMETDFRERETKGSIQRKARVFDILNAGPRNRFTAAGLLVSNCRILDFVGNSGKHKLISCMDILGGKISEKAAERAKENALRDGKPKMVMAALSNAQIELEREHQKQMEKERLWREAQRSHLMARSNYALTDVNPFGHNHEFIPIHKRQTRDGKIFSQRQAQALRELGCEPNKLGFRQGHAIISRSPSPRQKEALLKHGINPKGMNRKQASEALDKVMPKKKVAA